MDEFSILSEFEKERLIDTLKYELSRINAEVAAAMPAPPGYRFVQRSMNICVCQSCARYRSMRCLRYRRAVRPSCVCDEWERE